MARLILFAAFSLLAFTASADVTDSLNRFFATQWGPTQFNLSGHPDGYADCGPTTLLMGASSLGLIAPPDATAAESEIRQMRNLIHGEPTPASGPTYSPMMIHGTLALKLKIRRIPTNAVSVSSAIQNGELVLLAGDPRTSWGLALDAERSYLHHYGAVGAIPPPTNGLANADHFGHWVIVFGQSPEGEFYIGDPLSTIGTIAVSAEAIDQYFAEWPIQSDALAITK